MSSNKIEWTDTTGPPARWRRAQRDAGGAAMSEHLSCTWKRVASFWVPGEPAPGGSKKPFVYKDKVTGKHRASMAPDNKRTKPWMTNVAAVVRQQYRGEMLTGPVRCDFAFYMPRPRCHYRTGRNSQLLKDSAPLMWHTVKPDRTKLVRSTEDAMKGIIWKDDCQVCAGPSYKVWSNGEPGAMIDVYVLDNSPEGQE